jgi:sterol desaturase/sphingolipid hydroxylase (fatty acid hydroxylase superfamily)
MQAKPLPHLAKHLDTFSYIDYFHIAWCKLHMAPFSYFCFKYCVYQPNIPFGLEHMTMWNTIPPFIATFLILDFFCTSQHRMYHMPLIYQYSHKFHHKQFSPHRGNLDVALINPSEIFLVHYNHLLAVYICNTYLFQSVHFSALLGFFMISGVLGDLNHVRYDIVFSIPFFGRTITLYDSKIHEVHHRHPNVNFQLNTPFWDHVLGTYR